MRLTVLASQVLGAAGELETARVKVLRRAFRSTGNPCTCSCHSPLQGALRLKYNHLGTGSPRMLQCFKVEPDRGSDDATEDMGPLSHGLGKKNGTMGQRRSALKCTREIVSSSFHVA